jgi:uncharacterized membrane protein YraQ (UPF0718 family)
MRGMDRNARDAAKRTARGIWQVVPVLAGVILLVALAITAIPREAYSYVFSGNPLTDPLAGAVVGSVAAGNPVNSYVIGGELLSSGVSIMAVAAFIAAWVSVGLVQLPAESAMLGKRFAFARNGLSFLMAIIVGIIVSFVLGGVA